MPSDSDVLDAVDARKETIQQVVEFVHAHPELGHAEYVSSAYLAGRLEDAGLTVERGIGGMQTAFRATLSGAMPGNTVGLVMLYDAVPSVQPDGSIVPVHSCGHGPISGGVIAAVSALASLREQLAGQVIVLGCPADEIHAPAALTRGGGKAISAAAGLWDDMDAALYAHPEFINTVSKKSLYMRRDTLHVFGSRSLARGVVQTPIVALRQLMAALDESDPASVMLEHARLDGDVEEATGLVFDATVLHFAGTAAEITAAAGRLRERMQLGEWSSGELVLGIRPNDAVTSAVAGAFRAAGRDFVYDPPPLPFATDFGNISHRVPAALIGVGQPGGWSYHTEAGAAQFGSRAGLEAALDIARVLALSATRLSAWQIDAVL
ncbi:M20/M25/M40 family metallo-hydrolase [Rathayibacter soli]|uniref:M20/M25/M40 family metallo-hydrolase n=1 Tax=Rathayibacter soli TaxID=3144168 RepID=UPI0027E4AC65|nr:M20/M25/M40 family metallo-hydrolase [Glaciibacter superstes]